MELLWREKWTKGDGLGALVIAPTRELAMQTFEVLRTVGCYHDFSAALLIGGTVWCATFITVERWNFLFVGWAISDEYSAGRQV